MRVIKATMGRATGDHQVAGSFFEEVNGELKSMAGTTAAVRVLVDLASQSAARSTGISWARYSLMSILPSTDDVKSMATKLDASVAAKDLMNQYAG